MFSAVNRGFIVHKLHSADDEIYGGWEIFEVKFVYSAKNFEERITMQPRSWSY